MHAEAYQWIWQSIASIPVPQHVVELGSKNINGSPRGLLPKSKYVGVDLVAGPGVDVVMDGALYTPAESADLVLCCEVLEHAPDPGALVQNAVACTKTGGHVIVTCATTGRQPHSGIDGGTLRRGEHYRNITPEELRGWLKKTKVIGFEVALSRGDLYAFCEVMG